MQSTSAPPGYLLGSSPDEQKRLHDHLEGFGQKRLVAHLRPGLRVLDVGCGPGAVSSLLARAVGAEGSVVGVDMQAAQIEQARAHAESQGLSAIASFQVADATALPFADGTFDLVYAKFLVMHLPQPRLGLRDMVRVLRPGGTLFLYEVEAGGAVFWPADTPSQRGWEMAMQVLREGGSDPEIGRKLYGYFRELGLQDIRVIPEMTGACASQPRFLKAAKRQIEGVLTSLRDRVINGGHATADEYEELLGSLWQDHPDEFFTTTGVAAWGRRA